MNLRDAKKLYGYRPRSPYCCVYCVSFAALGKGEQLCRHLDVPVRKEAWCPSFMPVITKKEDA